METVTANYSNQSFLANYSLRAEASLYPVHQFVEIREAVWQFHTDRRKVPLRRRSKVEWDRANLEPCDNRWVKGSKQSGTVAQDRGKGGQWGNYATKKIFWCPSGTFLWCISKKTLPPNTFLRWQDSQCPPGPFLYYLFSQLRQKNDVQNSPYTVFWFRNRKRDFGGKRTLGPELLGGHFFEMVVALHCFQYH